MPKEFIGASGKNMGDKGHMLCKGIYKCEQVVTPPTGIWIMLMIG